MRACEYDFDVGDALEAEGKNGWEEEFLEGLREKYFNFGDQMFLSEKQADILRRISGC